MSYLPLYFFTDPYPDELIYSAIARFFYYNSQISLEKRMMMLFGRSVYNPSLFFTDCLDYLVNQLGGNYSVESIIRDNTIFPYYAPFISEEKQNIFIDNKGDRTIIKLDRGGINSMEFKKKYQVLRFCPECVKESVNLYGEASFNRLWNLPGIDICPIHHTYLENYPIKAWENYHRYIYPDFTLMETVPVFCENQAEIDLAESALYLMKMDQTGLSKEKMRKKIIELLRSQGLYNNRGLDREGFYNAMLDFYGREYLEEKFCLLDHDEYNYQQYQKLIVKKNCLIQPHLFLLSVNMLCGSFKTFMESDFSKKPVKNQWVCRNKACSNYQKPLSNPVYVKDGARKRVILCCPHCDMVYTSDPDNTDSFRIIQPGQKLTDLVKSLKKEGVSMSQTAKDLGIPTSLAQALRKDKLNPTGLNDRIMESRNCLITELSGNPDLNRTIFQKEHRAAYRTLSDYDSKWLNRILPQQVHNWPGFKNPKKDYSEADREYLVKAKEAYQMLLEVEPSIRIQQIMILNIIELTPNEVLKFPETKAFILKAAEDSVAFNIRKGKYWIDKLELNGETFSKSYLSKHKVYELSNPKIYNPLKRYYEELMNKHS